MRDYGVMWDATPGVLVATILLIGAFAASFEILLSHVCIRIELTRFPFVASLIVGRNGLSGAYRVEFAPIILCRFSRHQRRCTCLIQDHIDSSNPIHKPVNCPDVGSLAPTTLP
ncbi:hypothetical protein HYPSUDRAFT_61525 [Hypholoma sublateritium FD-334 SS-4]|uniref:Uncharacterized protein n=1 Tax=Hypholoma sublateritium (strain FD-334 SS-4) TaxID=945553 RepID=A0A0D2MZD4_HYPSF|nr:hypothetical protein HYPSUDRAFT_61525 [Hypholoma sublateritium FD-334 SS-4]